MSEKKFEVSKLYVKDISLENPSAPEVFKGNWEPKIELNLGNRHKELDDGFFEVELDLTVTAKLEDKTAYLLEVKQCGVFNIKGFEDAEKAFLINGAALNVLFPYAREAVTDLSQRAGFPAMVLNPINFEALYQQRLRQQNEGKEKESNEASIDE